MHLIQRKTYKLKRVYIKLKSSQTCKRRCFATKYDKLINVKLMLINAKND